MRPPRYQLANACQGKRRYRDLEPAQAEAARLHAKDGADMGAYWCILCGRYHVGHRAGSSQR